MGKTLPTLHKRGAALASGKAQLRVLHGVPLERSFEAALSESGLLPFRSAGLTVLQVNVGRLCNQTCRHCHVDAGPDRAEVTNGFEKLRSHFLSSIRGSRSLWAEPGRWGGT